ncbi:AAA family ATPase [Chloroflexi bacterium TSY]|nr:AAA family ATPase [Chloroflexi bacterium TSY]
MTVTTMKVHPLTRRPLHARRPTPQLYSLSQIQTENVQPITTGSREKLVVTIRRHIKRGQHVLLTGEYGSGRTWMLERMRAEFPGALHLTLSQSKREVILTICERLFDDGLLLIDDADDWEAATKKLKSHTIPKLIALIAEHMNGLTLILDDLDKATEKTVLEIVKPLLDGIVLAAADINTLAKRRRVQSILDRFKQIEMPQLDEDEARTMIWSLLDREEAKHANTIEKKILRTAQGMPGIIFDMCEQLRGSGGNLAAIRELEHSNVQVRRINLGIPLLFAAIIFLMASRYVFRGFDDNSLILLAGVGSVLASVLLRPLIYKIMR